MPGNKSSSFNMREKYMDEFVETLQVSDEKYGILTDNEAHPIQQLCR